MATKTSELNAPDSSSSSFELAIKVIWERIHHFCKEDQDDILEMIGIMVSSDTEEEKEDAKINIIEILEQGKGKIVPLGDIGEDSQELSGWAKYVGEKIKEERKQRGLTQDELANKAGLQQAHISRIESGVHSPNRKTMEKIAGALELPVSHFDPSEDK